MKKYLLLLLLAAPLSVRAEDVPLKFQNPWIVAVPPNSKDSAAFVTVVNPGSKPVKITSVRGEIAKRMSPMITTNVGGSLGMKDVPFIEVPAGGKAVLKPGGDHLMLYGLKAPLKIGEKVTLTLTLEPGGSVEVEFPVSRQEPK